MNESSTHTARALVALRRQILNGELPGGTRLLEVAVAERLQISRTPAREAMARLVEEGLIEAEILLKNYGDRKKNGRDPADENNGGPFAALKSIFSPKKSEDEGDVPLDIPDNLQ